jgi:indole-3-glycerol phosphate synthase
MKLTEAIRQMRESYRVPLIAEIKVCSPKDGDLLRGRDPGAIVRQYETAGACAISVVTESGHFRGSLRLLEAVRKQTSLPIFRKDFFADLKQLEESKTGGASAVLLIASMLSATRLKELNEGAHALGLETVVEIHNEADLQKLPGVKPDILGINNKDIVIFEKDADLIQPTLDLIGKVRHYPFVLSESGLRSLPDIRRVLTAGADAVLMGTMLLTAPDIPLLVRDIVSLKTSE